MRRVLDPARSRRQEDPEPPCGPRSPRPSRSKRLLLAALLALFACAEPAPPPPPEPVARIALFREPETLDPLLLEDTFSWTISRNLFEGLVVTDPDGSLRPAVASSWANPDDRTWDLVVREGIRFHDGRPVGVDDLVASLSRARDDPESAYSGNLASVERIVALDRQRVRITTREPDPLLLYRLLEVPVLPGGGARDEDGVFVPVGTGPYVLASHRPGEELEIEAFADYWGRRPAVERAVFVFESSTEEASRLLRAGELDLASFRVDDLAAIRDDPCCRVLPVLAGAVYFLTLPVGEAPWSDPRVRRALDLAIDRERYVAGDGTTPLGLPASQMVAPTVFGFDPSIEVPRPDPEAVRRLLEEAGHRELEVPVWHLEHQRIENLRQSVVSDRIRLVSRPLPTEEFRRRRQAGELGVYWSAVLHVSGDATEMFVERAVPRTPDGSRGGSNVFGYADPELEELVDRAARELDPERRRALLHRAMRLLGEDRPYLPVFYPYSFLGHSSRFVWTPRADGTVRLVDARPAAVG